MLARNRWSEYVWRIWCAFVYSARGTPPTIFPSSPARPTLTRAYGRSPQHLVLLLVDGPRGTVLFVPDFTDAWKQ